MPKLKARKISSRVGANPAARKKLKFTFIVSGAGFEKNAAVSALAEGPILALPERTITLNSIHSELGTVSVKVKIAELITYCQDTNYTHLNLSGGEVLHVKETTDEIDRLVRKVAMQK